MANEIPIVTQSFIAGADLRTAKGLFVKLSAARTVVVCTATTDRPVGVVRDGANTGGMVTVISLGQAIIVGNADLAVNAVIGTHTNGKAVAKTIGTDTTHYMCGYVLDENGAGDGLISAWINCIMPARGA